MSNKLFIQTLGCQMNVRDSEHMIAELQAKKDYSLTNNPEEADLLIINTCSVRDKPVRRLFSEIGNLNKKKKNNAKIGICGCTASHLGAEIIEKSPCVSFVLGARNISKITKAIETDKFVDVEIDYDESTYNFKDFRGSSFHSSINISIGCDKKCTFCIVPYTRGEEISIPEELIINEAKREADRGVKEIFLIGQNVNNYGKTFSDKSKKGSFVHLLQEISKIEKIQRIRFTSPHPLHMDDEFIEEFATNDKICKYIHMPLQSGSTSILKSMKRGYTKEWFLNRASKIRELVPNVTISTDIIVGFPNESEEDFLDTLDVVKQVKFEQIFNFKYSVRDYTKAKYFDNQVSDEVASSRLDRLKDQQKSEKPNNRRAQLGKAHKAMIEEEKEDYFVAKSDNNFIIFLYKDNADYTQEQLDSLKLGEILNVKVVSKYKSNLVGVLNV